MLYDLVGLYFILFAAITFIYICIANSNNLDFSKREFEEEFIFTSNQPMIGFLFYFITNTIYGYIPYRLIKVYF